MIYPDDQRILRATVLAVRFLFAAAALSACAPANPYAAPKFPFLAGYASADHGAPVLLRNDVWWTRARDPVLDRLVAEALRGNISLEVAAARVDAARAVFAGSSGAISLSSSLQVSGSGPFDGSPTGAGAANLGLGWLLDPYGARRAEANANAAGIEVAEAEVAAARLLVLNNLANAYMDLRYRQTLLGLRNQEMRGRKQTLAMTRTLFELENATRLDIARSEARVAELEAQVPGLRASIQAQQNEIAVLVGVQPGTLGILGINLDTLTGQPKPDMAVDVGIPADLIRNRPDIHIAERRYYIALAGLTAAEAALYPRLSLSGSITLNAAEGGRSGAGYSFGPTLQLPSFPGTAARAGVAGARARIAAAHAEWKATVLGALVEVENAQLDYRATTGSVRAAAKAARLYREALGLTRTIFTKGDATLGDLIAAETAVAGAEQAQAEVLYRRGLSFVALNVRLGAGHGVDLAPVAQR